MRNKLSGDLSGIAPLSARHLSGLDGLRGLAILMVMGHHILPHPSSVDPLHTWMRAFVDTLWMGVDLFFVISGFLITGILLDTLDSEHYFRNFYMRRVLRIFPLYYFVILVFILCTSRLHIVWGHQLLPLLTYTNRIFIDPHHPGFNFFFGGFNNFVNFWSLAVEEQFYFVWPLLIFLFRRSRNLFPIGWLLAFASVLGRLYLISRHTAPDVIYASLACRADALLIGGLLALAVRRGSQARLMSAARSLAIAGIVALLIPFVHSRGIHYYTPYMMRFGLTANALFFASLVALTLNPKGMVTRVFSASWLRFFGRYSYGLYILHSVLPAFYAARMARYIASLTTSLALRNGLQSVGEFVVSIAAAMLSYHLLEQPFLRLKKFFPSFAPVSVKTSPIALQPAPVPAAQGHE